MTEHCRTITEHGRLERWEQQISPIGLALLIAVAMQILVTLLFFNPGWSVSSHRLDQTFIPLCQNPWTTQPLTFPNTRHRLLIPLLAWLSGTGGLGGVSLAITANTLALAAMFRFFRRAMPANTALLALAVIASTLVGIGPQSWLGFADGLANLAIVLCLLTANPWLAGLIMCLGMFGDERAATTIPLIIFWQAMEHPEEHWLKLTGRWLVPMALSGVIWLTGFFAVHEYFTPRAANPELIYANHWTYLKALFSGWLLNSQLQNIPFAFWSALRGAWLMPWLWIVRSSNHRLPALILTLAVIPTLATAPLVHDMSRVMAFAFPAYLIALIWTWRVAPRQCHTLLIAGLLVNLLSPQYDVVGWHMTAYWPIPVILLAMGAGYDGPPVDAVRQLYACFVTDSH